ncbi:putative RING finger membrane protein [Cyphellophora attinorum]|uniref:Putative RING finger membrane protein n=1 Tax=Cyphellophora attinorum TaxID=1664694 RepID=A0A0N0NR73_9EURO|nr:putative RING finger membrane protein [Phialophora attinorum]KPI44758.1 putative RING finger membrane protein [Phialophora attinorum]
MDLSGVFAVDGADRAHKVIEVTPQKRRQENDVLQVAQLGAKRGEEKPTCGKCIFRGEKCEWDTGLTFRLSGLDADHPSMLLARPTKRRANGQLKIVDVRFDDTQTQQAHVDTESLSNSQPGPSLPGDKLAASLAEPESSACDATASRTCSPSCVQVDKKQSGPTTIEAEISGRSCKPQCQRFPYELANPVDLGGNDIITTANASNSASNQQAQTHAPSSSDSCSSEPLSGTSLATRSGSTATSLSSISAKHGAAQPEPHLSNHDHEITYLECLDHLLLPTTRSNDARQPKVRFSVPAHGARERLLEQIRLLTVSPGSDSSDPGADLDALNLLSLSGAYRSKGLRLVHQTLSARPLGCTKLDKRRQLELWQNYSKNIAPWLDVCESRRHFQYTLPMMAKSSDALHYAVLAVSSRHLELQAGRPPTAESSELCRDAERLMHFEIRSLDASSVAALLLLCVHDMMAADHRESQDSMEACASFLKRTSIDARSSGFEQSLFWAFAMLSNWDALAHSRNSVLRLYQFFPSESLSTAMSYIRSQTWGEAYSKYALYLSMIVTSSINIGNFNRTQEHHGEAPAQWKALHDLLEDWHNCRPEGMQALMSYPSILDDEHNRFPMLLYSSAAAVIGNLLYHTASLLLLECKPSMIELPKNHKSLIWHSRQICGIVAENHEAGVLPHARRPLLVAATHIADELERGKITEMLQQIERASGWLTAQAAQIISVVFPDQQYDRSSGFTVLNETAAYRFETSNLVTTLNPNNPNNWNVLRGVLYVPDVPDAACPNDTLSVIPANVTRGSDLPSSRLPPFAIAPWTTPECVQAFLSSMRADAVAGAYFFHPDGSNDAPPNVNDPSWSLNDGGQWQGENQYGIYALPGAVGAGVLQALGQYSGNISNAPGGQQLSEQFDPHDLIRLVTQVDVSGSPGIPSLWVFLIIVLAILLAVVLTTSVIMHCIQRRQRRRLQRRVERGEVDLEALGIKRLNVPKTVLDKMPIYTYTSSDPAIIAAAANADKSATEAASTAVTTSRPRETPYSQLSCPICLDDFIHGVTPVRELPCNHIFHSECIDPFLQNNSSLCPMCKATALPAGYCPVNVTNIMVRRERLVRRMRARANGEEATVAAIDAEAGHGIMRYLGIRIRDRVRGRRATTAGATTSAQDPEHGQATELQPTTPAPPAPAAVTSSGANGEVVRERQAAEAEQIPDEIQAQGASARRAWLRDRFMRREEQRFEQEGIAGAAREQDRRRPAWRRGLNRVFPTSG